MKRITFVLFIAAMLLALPHTTLQAKPKKYSGQAVTLVTYGEGPTRDEATKIALRSALEQAYGTFVSADTKLVNDELVKDEIVSIATGNILYFKELSYDEKPNGMTAVMVEATVAINNLQSYAQSHGASAELAGATFAMNVKMYNLNKESEMKALQHLDDMVREFIMHNNLYDYKIEMSEPKKWDGGKYRIEVKVLPSHTAKTRDFIKSYKRTLAAMSYQGNDLKKMKQGSYVLWYEDAQGNEYYETPINVSPYRDNLILRNEYRCTLFPALMPKAMNAFKLVDNNGKVYTDDDNTRKEVYFTKEYWDKSGGYVTDSHTEWSGGNFPVKKTVSKTRWSGPCIVYKIDLTLQEMGTLTNFKVEPLGTTEDVVEEEENKTDENPYLYFKLYGKWPKGYSPNDM